jgi:hypothetical protein
MSIKKTLLNFIVDDSLLKRIEDFRYKNRFPTRAAAIKWLLDWALKQKPSIRNLMHEPEEDHPAEVGPIQPPVQSPAVPAAPAAKPERATVASRDSMIQALRDQGYEVGETARHPDGQERILVRSHDRSAWVNAVQELQELVASRTTLAELSAKRAAGR